MDPLPRIKVVPIHLGAPSQTAGITDIGQGYRIITFITPDSIMVQIEHPNNDIPMPWFTLKLWKNKLRFRPHCNVDSKWIRHVLKDVTTGVVELDKWLRRKGK